MSERTLAAGLDSVVVAPTRELGDGFEVRRALPTRARRMVGPLVFFDQMGPAQLGPGRGLDVRPHPHIGLATVTYLFEGELVHRDSLGSVQAIRPGAVNWMVAGRGIVHSERTPPELRPGGSRLAGLQTWVALPEADEERAPEFVHHPAGTIPSAFDGECDVSVLVGEYEGLRSPVGAISDTLYVAVQLAAGARFPIRASHEERAFYVVSGAVAVEPDEGGVFSEGELVVLRPGAELVLRPVGTFARVMLFGGEPLGPRHVRWNFVSSSLERIHEASRAWQERRFAPVPGESEFIPLPERMAGVVSYP